MTTAEIILGEKITDLIYGLPGSGKSDAIKHAIIQALRENPGKIAKIVVGDGSAPTYQSLVRAGKAEICYFINRPWPLDVMNKLTSGWWLKDPKDPNSELVKPTKDTLEKFCASAWEGTSVMGRYILGSVKGGLAERAAAGVQMGPDPLVKIVMAEFDDKGNLKDGPETAFGTNGTAHYMAAQGHIVDFINQSLVLPGHHWWTGHETIMEDQVNIGDLKNPVKIKMQQVIGGPEAAGTKLTPNLQRMFGNTLHAQSYSKVITTEELNELGKKDQEHDQYFRLYTRDHVPVTGATNIKYKACTRDVGKDFPQFFDGDRGEAILNFYRTLRRYKEKELADLKNI